MLCVFPVIRIVIYRQGFRIPSSQVCFRFKQMKLLFKVNLQRNVWKLKTLTCSKMIRFWMYSPANTVHALHVVAATPFQTEP